jgi:hypothetical protein
LILNNVSPEEVCLFPQSFIDPALQHIYISEFIH